MELFIDLLKQIKWGDSSRIFFKSALVKAINFIVMDEKEINRKVSSMETRIESLKKEFDKINLIGEGARSVRKVEESDSNEYGNEDDDFDIINTDEIDKMVSEVGNHKRNKGSSDKYKKSYSGKAMSVKEVDVKGKAGNEGNGITLIHDNLDKISRILKSTKISVYAMFIEAKPDRVEDKILYFRLNKNKQWHKNHLNKNSNADLISDTIKKVTGRDYIVRFEIKEENNENKKEEGANKASEVKDSVIENKDSSKSSGVEKNTGVSNGKSKNNDDGEDVLGYFEKKFNIKE